MVERKRPKPEDKIEEHEVTPEEAAGDSDEFIDNLAALSILEYEQRRTSAAKELRCRASVLDHLVAQRRLALKELAEVAAFMEPIQPCPEPVKGNRLLDEIADTIDRYLVLPKYGPETLALWTVHCHTHDAARHSPILFVTSPTKQCGKTNLLATLTMLVPKPLSAANVTPATVFRAIARWHPTLLIDESDTFIADKSELRGVLNSGHTRSQAFVLRCVGDDLVPTQFSTWSPKAFAAIGRLHPTLEDRSIKIELRRKLRSEKVERIPSRDDAYAELRSQIARWALDHVEHLRDANPQVPKELSDRGRDNWEPLLAIADAVGGDWPNLARDAALHLSCVDDDESFAIVLLKDLQALFETDGVEIRDPENPKRFVLALSSTEVADKLGVMEDRPWPEFRHGKPITTQNIARLLKPFKIFPRSLRIGGRQTQGYTSDRFKPVFARYLPEEGALPSTPQQILKNQELTRDSGLNNKDFLVEGKNTHNPLKSKEQLRVVRVNSPPAEDAHHDAGNGAGDGRLFDGPDERPKPRRPPHIIGT